MLNTSEVGTRLPTRQRKVIVTSIRSRTSWHSFPHAATLAMACLISCALWASNPTRSAKVWQDPSPHRVLFVTVELVIVKHRRIALRDQAKQPKFPSGSGESLHAPLTGTYRAVL
jgi:hypothetical protein